MSDPISALKGAAFDGLVQITEAGLQGMITLRGDLSSAPVKKAAKAVAGVDIPGQRGIAQNGDRAIAWMSPDELLVMVPHAEADAAVDNLRGALSDQHFLAENVSDARAMFVLRGTDAHVREVLAKLAPVDFAPAVFQPGQIRRTRLAQVAGAVWMPAEGEARVVCFRSVAQYVFDLLCTVSGKGSAVGYFK